MLENSFGIIINPLINPRGLVSSFLVKFNIGNIVVSMYKVVPLRIYPDKKINFNNLTIIGFTLNIVKSDNRSIINIIKNSIKIVKFFIVQHLLSSELLII